MKSQYINSNGILIHCKVAGAGEPVILLHGFPEFWYAWHKVIPQLAKKYQVIAPDLRGYNKTKCDDKPIDNFTFDKYIKDVVGLIDHFGGKVKLVGHDWGGAIAWMVAHYYPNLVERLVIINAPHPFIFNKSLKRNLLQIFRSYYMFLFQIPVIPEWLIYKNRNKFFKASFWGNTTNRQAFSKEDIKAYVEAYESKIKVKTALNIYRGIVGKPNALKENMGDTEFREKVSCKVLVLWGEQDKFLGKELTYNIKDYCLRRPIKKYLPDGGHWVIHEQPEKVLQHISKFFESSFSEVQFGKAINPLTLQNPPQL